MKKSLLGLMAVCMGLMVQAQLIFNQVSVAPGNSGQFFELYNQGVQPGGVNADCYSIVAYYRSAGEEGFYVLDLPNQQITPQGVLAASASSGAVQGALNWNVLPAGATLRKYTALPTRNGGYTASAVNTALDRLFQPYAGDNGPSYAVLLFNGPALADAFISGGQNYPAILSRMPDLSFTSSCGTPVNISFRSLERSHASLFSQASRAFVQDRDHFRRAVGPCGEWYGALRMSEDGTLYNSGFGLKTSFTCYDRSLYYEVQRYATATNSYTIRLYADRPPYGVLGSNDIERSQQQPEYNATTQVYSFRNITDEYVILVLDAAGECFDIVRPVSCTDREERQRSPVNFTWFDVQRNNAAVQVAWQTTLEQDRRGYEVQRRFGETDNWSTIAYVVPDLSAQSSTDQDLQRYMYGDQRPDLNRTAEYRVKVISRDGRYGYSDTRTVPALVEGRSVSVYPNPSTDGRFSINFGSDRSVWDVQLIDMNGRIVDQWRSISSNNYQISNIRPGHYLLRLVNRETGFVTTEKVVVAR
jgi:hypothetical protein